MLQGCTAAAQVFSSKLYYRQRDMQSEPPTQLDLLSKLPGWHALPGQEQAKILALVQDPSTFSQLLALQRAMFSPNLSGQAHGPAHPMQASSFASQLPQCCQPSQLLFNSQRTSHIARPRASVPTLTRELPSPPRLDRSLLQAPLPFWATQARHNSPAGLLAASTIANYGSRSGFHQASSPLADCQSDLFRSTSLGTNYRNSTLPDELSWRASSMPGSFQDIAARLHLNRAGINTATTSLIPVMSQDWLVIPFGTAQQLLPAHAGDVLSDDDGDAVMLIDENGHNWPMKCSYNRYAEAPASLQLVPLAVCLLAVCIGFNTQRRLVCTCMEGTMAADHHTSRPKQPVALVPLQKHLTKHTITHTPGVIIAALQDLIIQCKLTECALPTVQFRMILHDCKLGCRSQGRFQLGDGWKAFAQRWGLGHGEQVQLSRRFVSSGCIWLDVQLVPEEPRHAVPGMPSVPSVCDVCVCWRSEIG